MNNREIKFRVIVGNQIFGYEKIESGVWYNTILKFNPENFVRWAATTITWIDNKGKEIIRNQYTGLKDSNGKEIYEGDIFKGGIYKWDVVKFEDGKFSVNLRGARVYDLCELFDIDSNDYPEIIGNIYENPELLNK